MSVDVNIRLGYKDSAWFTANASHPLLSGQIVYCSDGTDKGKYKIGDGTTQLSSLTFYGGSGYTFSGTSSQYVKGDGTYATFPTNVSSFSNDSGYLTTISGLNISLLNNDSGYITSSALSPYLTSTTAASTYVPFTGSGSDVDLNGKVIKNFFISKTADATAKFVFDVSALSTATTRTLTVRDLTGTIALTSDLSGYLLATGATTGATSQSQVFTNGATLSNITSGSVLFAGTSGIVSQDNSNFYFNSTSKILSVNTNADFTGTDSVNVYNQYDSYAPNSTNTAGTATSAGFSISTSRGTGSTPLQNNDTDFVGGFNGWGHNGTAYAMLTDIRTYVSGSTSGNRGGQLEFYTKADNGSLTRQAYILNNGNINIGNAVSTSQRLVRIGQDSATVDIGSLVGTTTAVALYLNQSTPNTTNYALMDDGSSIYLNGRSANSIYIQTAATNIIRIGPSFQIHTPTTAASGAVDTFSWTKPNNTGQTASTAVRGFAFIAGTRQWATGAITTQKEFEITSPTYSFVGASTITSAYTAYFNAATAGTNATITNNYAAGFNASVDVDGLVSQGRIAAVNVVVSANDSTVVVRKYRINSGIKLTINSGATLRIL